MRAQDRQQLQIGRLGGMQLSKGWYVYVGSAFGPGGLAARVSRHLQRHKTRHWHIDHLIWATTVREVWYSQRQPDLEHCWAQAGPGPARSPEPFTRLQRVRLPVPVPSGSIPNTRGGKDPFQRSGCKSLDPAPIDLPCLVTSILR